MHARFATAGVGTGLVCLLVCAGAALAQYSDPPSGGGSGGSGSEHNVEATGNPFTGGLAFEPAVVRAGVGDVVRWTNTDFAVPHTATEDHFLWRLTGDYGDPLGLFPTGFGPGDSRERLFEAGTHSYFCEVHGRDRQSGVVEVPVALRQRRGRRGFRVIAKWALGRSAAGQVFDVQRRRGGRAWRPVRDGTRASQASFGGGPSGTVWRFRARLRDAEDQSRATGYSPPARIKAR